MVENRWNCVADHGGCCWFSVDCSAVAGEFGWAASAVAAVVVVATMLLWLWTYRWQQRHRIEPKQWPILGSALEILSHFDDMHDWLLSYFQKGLKSFRVVLPGITYTYTVDPANIEYILKTNFNNFPKVHSQLLFMTTYSDKRSTWYLYDSLGALTPTDSSFTLVFTPHLSFIIILPTFPRTTR